MRVSRHVACSALLLCGLAAAAAQSSAAPSSTTQPNISSYIHESWDKLSRSTTECASLTDTKVSTVPVLYLPADQRIPADVRALTKTCKVDVRKLPKAIHHQGDVVPADLKQPGLLYLPHPYVVPGGRFNEMYGWDSYFILLGEITDGRVDLARGTVENFFYEIEHYGAILNANRSYYLTRSQPPFLSSMVLEVYRAELKSDPVAAKKWLREAWPYLKRDHELWISEPHLAGTTGLARYSDLGHGPVPEMSDDSSYYVDIIHWLQAHPKEAPKAYLEPAKDEAKCAAGEHCLRAEANGVQLTESFFAGDRAMRESGFDTSFRFGPYSGSTEEYAPSGLNALLYKYERDVAFIAATLGERDEAIAWSSTAGTRLATIRRLLWNDSLGIYTDYNFRTQQQSTYAFATTFYALWAGVATQAQAQQLRDALPEFERKGGLLTSTHVTGVQWDAPFGWAPLNWLAVAGLERYGFDSDARRLAKEFMRSVDTGYEHDGTIREKYNVEQASSEVIVGAGYKSNVIGFGWTNGVYAKMQELLAPPASVTAKP
ncbi:MAG: trehalase family glycosidase [Acidobacteriaceae bacterium]|nr:trehalase family glycosidase [Acidobacteriaceae bacterium]